MPGFRRAPLNTSQFSGDDAESIQRWQNIGTQYRRYVADSMINMGYKNAEIKQQNDDAASQKEAENE